MEEQKSQSPVLLVEDDRDIRALVEANVRSLGYEVEYAEDGEYGAKLALDNDYQLIILDINLPYMDGIEVCQKIRSNDQRVPILMLTARDEEIDRVRGLELGADDYLTKPFSVNELRARIKALLRRLGRQQLVESQVPPEVEELVFAELKIEVRKRKVFLEDQLLDLSAKEFDLLLFLALHPGVPYTRSQLLRETWGSDFMAYESNVTTHINRLRRKLGGGTSRKRFIKTARGVGYRFAEQHELE